MAPSASDLVFYPSANMPFDDYSTSGGAINTSGRLMDAVLLTREKLNYVSSSALDITQRVTVRGLSFGGLDVIEQVFLNGTTVVKGKLEFRRILDITLSASCAGTVSIRRQSDSVAIRTIATGITKYTTLFKFAYPLEIGELTRYEKVFVKNIHGTDTLNDASIALISASGIVSVGLAASKGDSVSVATRRDAPSGITFEDVDEYIDLPGDNLTAGQSIGIWIKQILLEDVKVTEANSNVTLHLFGD